MDGESDIDLLVELPAVNWDIEKSIGNSAFDAGLEIGRVISTICFGKTDLADGSMRSSPLIFNIWREGMALCCDSTTQATQQGCDTGKKERLMTGHFNRRLYVLSKLE